MNVLIGSRALAFWENSLNVKDTTDWDVISDKPIKGTEWHNPHFLNNGEMAFFYSSKNIIEFNGEKLLVMKPKGLSIIKRSHLWRNLSFQKHITHYHKYLTEFRRGCYNEADEYMLEERIKLTKEAFPQGHPSLNKTVEEFFDDYVEKKYDHDFLHELVAFYEKPMYTRLQRDSSKAWCDKDLWDTLSIGDRHRCVSEEAQVIAIERFLVPKDWNYPIRHAYMKALDKVCTTLCSGWFRDHAIDYYPEIIDLCNVDKFEHIRKELSYVKS